MKSTRGVSSGVSFLVGGGKSSILALLEEGWTLATSFGFSLGGNLTPINSSAVTFTGVLHASRRPKTKCGVGTKGSGMLKAVYRLYCTCRRASKFPSRMSPSHCAFTHGILHSLAFSYFKPLGSLQMRTVLLRHRYPVYLAPARYAINFRSSLSLSTNPVTEIICCEQGLPPGGNATGKCRAR